MYSAEKYFILRAVLKTRVLPKCTLYLLQTVQEMVLDPKRMQDILTPESYNQARPEKLSKDPAIPPFGFCSQVKPTSPDYSYKSWLSAKVDKRGQKCSFDFLEQAVFYDRLNLMYHEKMT